MLTPEQVNTIIGAGILIGAIVAGIWRAMSNKMNRMDSSNQAQLKDTNDSLDKLQIDLDKARGENRDFRNRIEELNRQIDSSNSLVRSVERNNAMLQGRLDEQGTIYGKQFVEATRQLAEQAIEIAHLRQSVAERDVRVSDLNRIVEELKATQRDKDQQLTTANSTIGDLKKQLNIAQEAVTELTKRVVTLETQVEQMTQELRSRDDLLIEKDRQITELTTQLTTQKAESEAKYNDLEDKYKALQLMVTPLPADPVIAPEVPQP